MQFLIALAICCNLIPSTVPADPYYPIHNELTWLCIRAELLDEREVTTTFVKREDFAVDLGMIRQRYHDLCYAPMSGDALRFVHERDVIVDLLSFNRAYVRYLTTAMELYPERLSMRAAKSEAEELYKVWDYLRDAKTTFYYVHIRRKALKQLREAIGAESYELGRMPPHVPEWRFTEVP